MTDAADPAAAGWGHPSPERSEVLGRRFPPLLVAADRVASTVSQGVHGRRRVGQGETFWQFRRYQPGDAASRIDWRASGKSQQLFVRELEWEAAQSVWLWRDSSASMAYASLSDLPQKAERGELLLMALVGLLLRGGERVALLGENQRPENRRATLQSVAERLMRDRATPRDAAPFEPLPRYAHAVFVSDFLAPLEDIERYIGRFVARGVRGHLLQVLDPAELTLPFRGRVRFAGVEGEPEQPLLGRVETIRGRYVRRFEDHAAGLQSLAKAANWSFTRHTTDHAPEHALLALYMAMTSPLEAFG